MGASGKWIKSIINLKKPNTIDQDKVSDNTKKKWKLWRSSSEGFGSSSKGLKRSHVAGSEASDSSVAVDDAFTAAVATVVRAPPKDFMVVKQEWAAIRIQTAFRGLLARRALRALKAVVRIQAIFRGRQVRKQAAVTLRCMQALVRVQARVRAQSAVTSSERKAAQQLLDQYHSQPDPTRQAEKGWCASPGTVDEVKAKLQMRKEGAIKRERAFAYSRSHRQPRSCSSPNWRKEKSSMSLSNHKPDKSSPAWAWLDRWMAAKPWENRLMEECQTDPSQMTPVSRKSDDHIVRFHPYSTDLGSVKVRKNNVTTKIAATPPSANSFTRSSLDPSYDSPCDERSGSSSSISASLTPGSSDDSLVMDKAEEGFHQKPNFMNITQSTKAKQRTCRYSSHTIERHAIENSIFLKKSMALSSVDTISNSGSDPSYNLGKDLYPPMPLGRQDLVRGRQNKARIASHY